MVAIIVMVFLIIYLRKQQEKGKYSSLGLLLIGKPDYFDRNRDIKAQAALIPYNSGREIPRNSFEVGDQIGSGNFGSVHKGHVTKFQGTNCKPEVAIKSISGIAGDSEIENFLYEIKIMSYVDPHINLVSMIGACTRSWTKVENCG